jgi:DNA-binding PadR family transcriptional regulator
MSDQLERDLTTLEYFVLGQISQQPQSGYSLITTFEAATYRWSASPGSVYPILKRLEKQGILSSELEMVHETRPRKMYSLTPLGEEMLDEWLKRPLTRQEVTIDRDLVLRKFLLMEQRLSHQEILAWLDNYEQETEAQQIILEIQNDPEITDLGSVHHQLVREAVQMDIEMQRQWIHMTRRRLEDDVAQTPDES